MLGIYCRVSKESETSILQQRKLGIQFSTSMYFEYQLYEDEGFSGYITSDNDIDPFNNRPAFTSMINDIKSGIIDKVWVYEISRLSRNDNASSVIFNIFDKNKIDLYENGKLLNLDDPQYQLMRSILSAMAQYEWHLIRNRITRGLHNAINSGNRSHARLYGYEKDYKDETGRMLFKLIKSEISQIKMAFDKYLNDASLQQIIKDLGDVNSRIKTRVNLSRCLSHIEYTGYSFNIEGLKIYKQLISGEVNNFNILNDKKYLVKSNTYTEQLISINDWFKVFERLISTKVTFKNKLEKNKRAAKKGLATGLIKCSLCGSLYYTWNNRYKKKREDSVYSYYKHTGINNNTICKQEPKGLRPYRINEIYKIFMFFNCVVFDLSEKTTKDILAKIKQEIDIANEKLEVVNSKLSRNDKQIEKFNKALDTTEDIETIKILAKRISESKTSEEILLQNKSSILAEINELSIKYSGTQLNQAYYNIKDYVLNFFNNLDDEERRNILIKRIKDSYIFKNYLLIDTGVILFLFDVYFDYKFDMNLLDNLDKDLIYRDYFIEMTNLKAAQTHDGKKIANIKLDKKMKSGHLAKDYVKAYLSKQLNINYDISSHTNLVAFMSLRGLYSSL